MKRTSKSFSHKLITFLLFSFVIISCERIDSDLIGNWTLTERSYLITASQDFTFNDLFGEPWQGTILIDDEEFNTSSFTYRFYNVWPTNQFSSRSGELVFIFFDPKLEIYLNGDYYMLDSYEFDIASGIFNAEGIANGNDKSLQVKVNAIMPKISMKKGEQAVVKVESHRASYTNLEFKNGGKLQTDYLMVDIMDRLSGKWSVKNDRITLSVEKYENDTYQYNFNGNELILSKDNITRDEIPFHLSPFADKLSNITYHAVYK